MNFPLIYLENKNANFFYMYNTLLNIFQNVFTIFLRVFLVTNFRFNENIKNIFSKLNLNQQ